MEKIELEGTLGVDAEDFFEIEGEPDTYQGTKRSPLMFTGQITNEKTFVWGTLELIIKSRFPNLFLDNKEFPFRVTIEAL